MTLVDREADSPVTLPGMEQEKHKRRVIAPKRLDPRTAVTINYQRTNNQIRPLRIPP